IGRSPRAAKSTAMYMSPWNGENGAKNFGYTNCSVSTYPANASAQSASVRKVKDQRSLANCPAVRCIERRSLTRERANPSERNRSVARCETRYGLSKGLALASKPGAPNGGEQEREVFVARAMVDDARAQRGAVRDARRADDRRAAFLDVDRDLRVEPVELIGGEAGDAIGKTDDVEGDGREQLQIRIGRDGSTQRRRQAARARDRRAEALDAVVPQREPDLEGAELARQLEPVVGEPRCTGGRAAFRAREIRRVRRERVAVRALVAKEHAPDAGRCVQPLVRVEGERVGAFDAAHEVRVCRARRGERAEGAVDVQPEILFGADVRQ